jgi:hypothetical protein
MIMKNIVYKIQTAGTDVRWETVELQMEGFDEYAHELVH